MEGDESFFEVSPQQRRMCGATFMHTGCNRQCCYLQLSCLGQFQCRNWCEVWKSDVSKRCVRQDGKTQLVRKFDSCIPVNLFGTPLLHEHFQTREATVVRLRSLIQLLKQIQVGHCCCREFSCFSRKIFTFKTCRSNKSRGIVRKPQRRSPARSATG